MSGNSHPTHPLKTVREPDKKPFDFRATSQQQSNAGTYDDRGGDRLKKVLLVLVAIAIVVLVATIAVDAIAGQGIF